MIEDGQPCSKLKNILDDREKYREGKVKSDIIIMKRFWILMLNTGKALCFTVPFV